MIPILSLYLVLAGGVSVAAPATQPATANQIVRTFHTAADGTTTVEERVVNAAETSVQTFGPNGRLYEATSTAQKRVLIELHARPILDRTAPGSAAAVSSQRRQLGEDLASIDARLQTKTPSTITREYDTLFSGVAATVDAAAVEEIRRLPNVAAVHEDVIVRAALTTSVPMIGASTVAGTYGVTGAGIRVAVLDTGIDYTHADLGGCLGVACKVAGGYDFVNDDSDPRDDHGHGTHVAGIISANGTLKGVAPGATLLAYKVLDSAGYGFASDIIAGLEQAMLDGANVANLSLGGEGSPDDPASQALDNATAAGVLSVVAAGNRGPAYQTVQSPGTARTALTVGATNKSWQMEFSSSRGYVSDGDHYFLKPEIVAPGGDIRSTVPTLRDPSGYSVMSGTSMAAPHVAGSAALLLQWNAAQTPEELKSRMVTSARVVSGDLFTTGAGGIDLVAAFGARIVTSPAYVSFDAVSETSGVVVRERTLSLKNTGATAQSLTLTAMGGLPAGTTLEIVPSSATLQPGESADITLRLSVDAAVVPDPTSSSMDWSTSIAITGQSQTVKVPVYFLRGALLRLSFEEIPDFVYVISESHVHDFHQVGPSLNLLVKRGLWDVVAYYWSPTVVVVREQQDVQQQLSLNIGPDDAIRTATIRAVDDEEQPLDESKFSEQLLLRISNFTLGVGAQMGELRLSELSSRIAVGLSGTGPDPSGQRFFISTWAAEGFSSDVTLPVPGAPWRRLVQAVTQPTETVPTTLVIMTGFVMRDFWILGGGVAPAPLSRTLYLQSTFDPDGQVRPVQQTNLNELAFPFARVLEGPCVLHEGGAQLYLIDSLFRPLHEPDFEPDAILGAGIERWDLDTSPNAFQLGLSSSSSGIRASGFAFSQGWITHTLSMIRRVAGAEPVFDLYRNGALAGTYPLQRLIAGISSPAGAHVIRSTSNYRIGEVPGSSRVAISFNTANTDPDPPFVSRFRIEQNGVRTPAPYYPATHITPTVQFRVTDRSSLSQVSLEWRANGDTAWIPLPLTSTGIDYAATIDQNGAVDLRLTAMDATGNTFEEEWSPALITAAPPPPEPPAFITAARATGAKILISWAAGTSPIGVSGYRIERLPDEAAFTTSGPGTTFEDTTGLIDGNAYFYRVSTIDTNDAVSQPSAYDLATLIELQDDPIVPKSTLIRGAHIVDLRRAIDAIRHAAGLPPAWTNYDAPNGLITAATFTEIRDRLNEARSVVQLPIVNFTNSVAPGALIRAADVQKLRSGVQ